jgi:hypothetical protein
MGEIITTDEFSDWFCGLGDDQAKAIVHVVEILRLKGKWYRTANLVTNLAERGCLASA